MQKKIKKRSVIFYTNSPVYFTVFPFRSTLSAMQMILMGTGTSHGIPVIEDAAHAAGTYYKGQHIGAQGTAIFSFHAIKNMTCAEGGLIVTDDEPLH